MCTLEDVIELIADALETSVKTVHASRRELAQADLDPNDFIIYHHPQTEYPHMLDTCKLSSLGWESTPPEVAIERTVAKSIASGRDGSAHVRVVTLKSGSSKHWLDKWLAEPLENQPLPTRSLRISQSGDRAP